MSIKPTHYLAPLALLSIAAPGQAFDGPSPAEREQAKPAPAPTIDTNKDGVPDAWDRNGDGKADAWDLDGDAKPDRFDDDGDGQPDPVKPGKPGER
jgi:hypothetical protein